MADVNASGDGGGTTAMLAIVVIAVLALLGWLWFASGGYESNAVKVGVDTPAQQPGSGGSVPHRQVR